MRRSIWPWAAFLLILTACHPGTTQSPLEMAEPSQLAPASLAVGERLRVAATTTIVGDVVAQVGGDVIELTVLLQPGTDPHTYQPRPSDLVSVAQAHLLLVNGLGLEDNLMETLENVEGDYSIVSISTGIEPRRSARHDRQEHGDADPHVWFDVHNVMLWADNAATALGALDPAHADVYSANSAAYRERLEELDAWIMDQVATLPEGNRTLVTNHPALGYFADRYGFEQVGVVYPVSPSSEPSAGDIARLEEAILEYRAPAVFTESTVNPALAQQVAQDTGVLLVSLYTGSLSEPGGEADSYIALMEYDVRAIVAALGDGQVANDG